MPRKRTTKSYGLTHLQIGESMIIPWKTDADGNHLTVSQQSLNNAVFQEARLKNKKFSRTGLPQGLLVKRLS